MTGQARPQAETASQTEILVDLTPPEVLARRRPNFARLVLIAAFLALLAWGGYLIFALNMQLALVAADIASLQAEHRALARYGAEAPLLAATLQGLRQEDAFALSPHRAPWAEALADIQTRASGTISSISWSGSTVEIRGQEPSLAALAAAETSLEHSPFWGGVTVTSISASASGGFAYDLVLTPTNWLPSSAAPVQSAAASQPAAAAGQVDMP